MAEKIFDLIIIGGGPAGLTAGLYASRAKLKCVLLEKAVPGGQVLFTDAIENFPGFSKPVNGTDLVSEMVKQAERFGLTIENDEALKVSRPSSADKGFIIETSSGKIYNTLSLIAASGAAWKHLEVPGEDRLKGKGVSYCASCDGPFFKGRDVTVVGGGDKALEESLYLAKMVNSVRLIHRRDQFRAVKELQERVLGNPKITPVYDSVVSEIGGNKSVEFVRVTNKKTKSMDIIPCAAVFIFIGIEPESGFLKGIVDMDEKGFVIVDRRLRSSVDGIYACGDVVKKDLYQIVTAVGEAAAAAFDAERRLGETKAGGA